MVIFMYMHTRSWHAWHANAHAPVLVLVLVPVPAHAHNLCVRT